jgi:putative PIN family toxin of toxin-antitoxin system
MIRIVLDTNVFISGVLTPGRAPAQLLELVLSGKIKLVISPQIIQEIQRVLQYPGILKLMKKRKLEEAVFRIMRVAQITPGAVNVQGVATDPSDDMSLACALEGQAEFIVSGDHHLTDLTDYQGIKILSQAEFISLMSDLDTE